MKSDNKLSIPEKIISVSNSIEREPVERIHGQLISLINELINKDFQALVQLLYGIDVDEKKIRHSLDQNSDIASASILADMIIERQLQKIKSRDDFNKNNGHRNDEERW